MTRGLVVLLVLTMLGVMAACSDEKIVLATDPDETDAGQMGKGAKCSQMADCQASAGEFCDIDHHDLGVGRCVHKPIYCNDPKFDPVCAPSGITYFNDCYRKRAGEPESTDGECVENVRACDLISMACPTGTVCNLLGSGAPGDKVCGFTIGRCWGFAKCPPPDPDDHDGWDECASEGGALRCVDACLAVQTGRPFAHRDNCR